MMLAWCILFAQHALLESSTLLGDASGSCMTCLLACAAWVGARLGATRVQAAPLAHRAFRLASALVASAAGAALALSPGGTPSYVFLALSVFFAAETMYHELTGLTCLTGSAYVGYTACALIVSGGLHLIVRIVTGGAGSPSNAGLFSLASLIAISLLPVASLLAGVGAPRHDGLYPLKLASSPDGKPSSADSHPRPLAEVARRRTGYSPVTTLPWLIVAGGAVAVFFSGVVMSPYQVNMLVCGDCCAIALVITGLAVMAVSRVAEIQAMQGIGAVSSVALAATLAGMIAFAISAEPIAAVPLTVVLASCAVQIAAMGSALACMRPAGAQAVAYVAAIVAVSVVLKFAGMAAKQVFGLDAHTLTAFVLVGMIAMLIVLIVAVLIVMASAERALTAVKRQGAAEAERVAEEAARVASEKAVDAIRHDPAFALEAMRTLYREFLEQYGLTKREEEVAVLQLEGNTIEAIAAATGISVNTVRFHLRHIYQKVGASGKLELRDKASDALAQIAHKGVVVGEGQNTMSGAPIEKA